LARYWPAFTTTDLIAIGQASQQWKKEKKKTHPMRSHTGEWPRDSTRARQKQCEQLHQRRQWQE